MGVEKVDVSMGPVFISLGAKTTDQCNHEGLDVGTIQIMIERRNIWYILRKSPERTSYSFCSFSGITKTT